MGWFTAKDTPSTEPVRGKTISDKDWRDLQTRAAKRNPEQVRFGSREQREATKRGAANYRNRHRN
ncbi:MAG: hypothetical protein ACRDXB_07235 [Actinomycetes bacterium]